MAFYSKSIFNQTLSESIKLNIVVTNAPNNISHLRAFLAIASEISLFYATCVTCRELLFVALPLAFSIWTKSISTFVKRVHAISSFQTCNRKTTKNMIRQLHQIFNRFSMPNSQFYLLFHVLCIMTMTTNAVFFFKIIVIWFFLWWIYRNQATIYLHEDVKIHMFVTPKTHLHTSNSNNCRNFELFDNTVANSQIEC